MKIDGLQSQTPQSVESSLSLALYEPDIAPNAGAVIRLAACFGAGLDVIEPCGFVWSDRQLRRSAMDYRELAAVTRHPGFADFLRARRGRRLVLLTTAGSEAHHRFAYRPGDILLLGRESAGVPPAVADACDARVRIAMRPGARSLNVAQAAAIVLSEALRQTGGLDHLSPPLTERTAL